MDVSEQAKRLRNAVARHGRAGRGNPYPEWLKRDAIEYSRGRSIEGASAQQVSRELGLPALTLARWAKSTQDALLPVVIEPALPACERLAVVHGPRGLRIEGLDIAALAALIRELS